MLSPTGRNPTRSEKRRIYADGGGAWYWLVDPAYQGEAIAEGVVAYTTDDPFAVRVVPAELTG